MNKPLTQPTFLIHDYETFGKHPALDRLAQFAGIRADRQFNILSDPQVFFCRPANDYLPQPEAVLISGITPQTALLHGVNEAEFAGRINKLFSIPDTCIIGYNNIRFDDEVSKNLFYRNFYDPYAWTWQKGNSRWDLLDVVRAFYALRSEGIAWPVNDDGLPRFRLEHLTHANGIQHLTSHDAMNDVYATLFMARLMSQTQPKLFKYFFHFRGKRQLKTLVDIARMTPLVYVSSIFGAARSNTAWIAPLAWHPNNQNILIVCDLSGNMKILEDLYSDTLRLRLYTQKNKLSQDACCVPIKLIHFNKCPVLVPTNTLRPIDAKRIGIPIQRCVNNLTWLRNKPDVRKKVIEIFYESQPFTASKDVDEQLYNGFFSDADRAAMNMIQSTAPEDLSKLAVNIIDSRFKPLLFRYRARNFPYTLNEHEQLQWIEHRKTRLTEWRLETYIHQLEILYQTHKKDEKNQSSSRTIKLFKNFIVLKLNIPNIQRNKFSNYTIS